MTGPIKTLANSDISSFSLEQIPDNLKKGDTFYIHIATGKVFPSLESEHNRNDFYVAKWIQDKKIFEIKTDGGNLVGQDQLPPLLVKQLDKARERWDTIMAQPIKQAHSSDSEDESPEGTSSKTLPLPKRARTEQEQPFEARLVAENYPILLDKARSLLGFSGGKTPITSTANATDVVNLIVKRYSSNNPLTENLVLQMIRILNNPLMSEAPEVKAKVDNLKEILNSLYEALTQGETTSNPNTPLSQGSEEEFQPTQDNINVVVFIKGANGQRKWVFKPEERESGNIKMVPKGERAKREHLASLLNFHGLFPIPPTFYVSFQEEIGSVQKFVEGKFMLTFEEPLEEEDSTQASEAKKPLVNVNQMELQSLIIFDLLFHNTDRSEKNFLLAKDKDQQLFHILGIDNGECLGEKDFFPVVITENDLLDENSFVDKEILTTILSNENVKKYQDLIEEKIKSPIAIERFELASELLKNGFRQYGQKLIFSIIVNQFQQLQADHQDGFLLMNEGFKEELIGEFMLRLGNLIEGGGK